MNKILKVVATFVLLTTSVGFSTKVLAEEAANSASTQIDVIIEDEEVLNPGEPIEPDPEDPDKPVDTDKPGVFDPDKDHQDLSPSRPNENIGDSKLAIWQIPRDMKFAGTYSQTLDYELNLVQTEEEEERYPEMQRLISIADVRQNQDGWTLKASLSDFDSDFEEAIMGGYNLSMTAEARKHLVDGKVVYAKSFEEDNDNGVVVSDEGKIVIDTDDTEIASATKDKGKGYTGLLLNDMKLNFLAGEGADGEYTGTITWTLSDTAQ